MKRIFIAALFFALAGTLAASTLAQGRGNRQERDDHHDNGKHRGWDKHADRGDHHDNGEHRGWDNPRNPHYVDYSHWNYDRARIRPGHRYPYGHYDHVRSEFVVHRFDVRTRHIFLADRSNWVVAAYDAPRCRDWDWDRDRVYVYNDDDHPGWYLLFNARLGAYVHVEFAGDH